MPSIPFRIATAITVVVTLYAILLGALLSPSLQRFALYAHKFNTLFWQDIDDATQFGFAKNQVTPFNIQTRDGVTLYAWHVLPVDVYTQNERILRDEKRPYGPVDDFEKTTAFRLLTSENPSPPRVVVSFHGNAGHVAQGWRTDTYRYLTTQPNTHVITIDYRGFGKSTGSPTEAGLIADGTALVNWVLLTTRIPPENIVILGQSLGTAVASAVALRFANPLTELNPKQPGELAPPHIPQLQDIYTTHNIANPTTFAGVILVAPFSDLPSLMLTYRIGGFIPILLPFRPIPFLANYLTSHMVDQWHSADRLAAYYSRVADTPRYLKSEGRNMGSLQILHAIDDLDITYRQTEMICRRMLGKKSGCGQLSDGPTVLDVKGKGKPRVRFEILGSGGHNRIITYSPVAAAVVRAFEDIN